LADHEVGESLDEWERRVHPEDLARVMEVVNRHLARGEGSYEVEFQMRHVDGAFRWIYTRAEIVRGADGRPRRILGCHVDITVRKRAEEALRESETRFRNVADHSPLILWM